MGLGVNTATYALHGIDVNNVQKVAQGILNSANKEHKVEVQSIDYSKFNRKALGIDLYSSRTDVELQKQIALTQAGLYAKSIDVARLNSKAAMNLYSVQTVQKNVELTQSLAQGADLIPPAKLEQNNNPIHFFNTQEKNSNAKNGFNPFTANEDNEQNEERRKQEVNIFA